MSSGIGNRGKVPTATTATAATTTTTTTTTSTITAPATTGRPGTAATIPNLNLADTSRSTLISDASTARSPRAKPRPKLTKAPTLGNALPSSSASHAANGFKDGASSPARSGLPADAVNSTASDVEKALAAMKSGPPLFGLSRDDMRRVDEMVAETISTWEYELLKPVDRIPKNELFRKKSTINAKFGEDSFLPFIRGALGGVDTQSISHSVLARFARLQHEIDGLRRECEQELNQAPKTQQPSSGPAPGSSVSSYRYADNKDLFRYAPFIELVSDKDHPVGLLLSFLSLPRQEGDTYDGNGLPPKMAAYLARLDAFLLYYYMDESNEAKLNEIRECAFTAMLGIHGFIAMFTKLLEASAQFGGEQFAQNRQFALQAFTFAFNKSGPAQQLKSDILGLNKKILADREELRHSQLKQKRINQLTSRTNTSASSVKNLLHTSRMDVLLKPLGAQQADRFIIKNVEANLSLKEHWSAADFVETFSSVLDTYAKTQGETTSQAGYASQLAWAIRKPNHPDGPIGVCAELARNAAHNHKLAKEMLPDDAGKLDNALFQKVQMHFKCLESKLDQAQMQELLARLSKEQ